LEKSYHALKAVSDFNADIESGRIYGLIGTNGAGKTTVLNLLSGMEKPTAGHIVFEGKEISGFPPEKVTRCGIARTFQNLRLFSTMTALDNVLVAAQIDRRYTLAQAVLRTRAYRQEDGDHREKALGLLRLFGLEGAVDKNASSLPYGHQRKLEIARALATGAKLVLLDEPAAGMNPQESAELMGIIARMRDELGVTVILVEHDMKVVMGICEFIYVMAFGEIIEKGAPGEIIKSRKVVEAYLGGEGNA
jgi:branched-chain amino acid transport system ATP-binding protein